MYIAHCHGDTCNPQFRFVEHIMHATEANDASTQRVVQLHCKLASH